MIDQPIRDDALTLACIGVVAACLSSVAHEAIGHGGTCIAVGGRIALLSSVYFRCIGGGAVTDAGGPLVPVGVIDAVREAALEIGIASIGLWFAAGRYVAPQAQAPAPGTILPPIARNVPWIVAGCIVFAVFTATMGRGI